MASRTKPTPAQHADFVERRSRLLGRIETFRKQQALLCPLVAARHEREELNSRLANAPAKPAEQVQLSMPSACGEKECPARMRKIEERLRRGQCGDALKALRVRLITRRWLTTDRNESVVGQRGNTRSQTLLASIGRRIRDAVSKYRLARAALVELVGVEVAKPYRELVDSDIGEFSVVEDDEEATRVLARGTSRDTRNTTSKARGKKRKAGTSSVTHQPGSTRDTLSWIWIGDGVPTGNDDAWQRECEYRDLVAYAISLTFPGVRVEWCKAYARRMRWWEEVQIIKEETRRVLRTLKWEQTQWKRRANSVKDSDDAGMSDGLRAYALGQAAQYERIAMSFKALWLREGGGRRYWEPVNQAALVCMRELVGNVAVNATAVAKHDEDALRRLDDDLDE